MSSPPHTPTNQMIFTARNGASGWWSAWSFMKMFINQNDLSMSGRFELCLRYFKKEDRLWGVQISNGVLGSFIFMLILMILESIKTIMRRSFKVNFSRHRKASRTIFSCCQKCLILQFIWTWESFQNAKII